MSASAGLHSFGTTLGIDPAGGTSFTLVAEVKNVDGPGIEVGSSEITNLTSPGGFKEFIAALADGGEVSFTIVYTGAQYNTLLGYVRKSAMAIQITLPKTGAQVTNGDKITTSGHITKLPLKVPEDDAITVDSITIKVTGQPTWAVGA